MGRVSLMIMVVLAGCSTSTVPPPAPPAPPPPPAPIQVVQYGGAGGTVFLFCAGQCPQVQGKQPAPLARPVVARPLAADQALSERRHFAVLFEFGEARLQARSEPVLQDLVRFAQQARMVDVIGRTDTSGPMRVNAPLAQQRAEVVSSALRRAGVAPERIRITVQPMVDQPVAPGARAVLDGADVKAQSRRADAIVEVRLTD